MLFQERFQSFSNRNVALEFLETKKVKNKRLSKIFKDRQEAVSKTWRKNRRES